MGFLPITRVNRPAESRALGACASCDTTSGLGNSNYFLPGTGPEPLDPGALPKWQAVNGVPEILSHPIYRIVSIAGTAAGAYHGYKRNNSIGWALGWGLLGAIFPVITIPVSLAQGFGKRKKK